MFTLLLNKIHVCHTTLEIVLHKVVIFICISSNKRISVIKKSVKIDVVSIIHDKIDVVSIIHKN